MGGAIIAMILNPIMNRYEYKVLNGYSKNVLVPGFTLLDQKDMEYITFPWNTKHWLDIFDAPEEISIPVDEYVVLCRKQAGRAIR